MRADGPALADRFLLGAATGWTDSVLDELAADAPAELGSLSHSFSTLAFSAMAASSSFAISRRFWAASTSREVSVGQGFIGPDVVFFAMGLFGVGRKRFDRVKVEQDRDAWGLAWAELHICPPKTEVACSCCIGEEDRGRSVEHQSLHGDLG